MDYTVAQLFKILGGKIMELAKFEDNQMSPLVLLTQIY